MVSAATVGTDAAGIRIVAPGAMAISVRKILIMEVIHWRIYCIFHDCFDSDVCVCECDRDAGVFVVMNE